MLMYSQYENVLICHCHCLSYSYLICWFDLSFHFYYTGMLLYSFFLFGEYLVYAYLLCILLFQLIFICQFSWMSSLHEWFCWNKWIEIGNWKIDSHIANGPKTTFLTGLHRMEASTGQTGYQTVLPRYLA